MGQGNAFTPVCHSVHTPDTLHPGILRDTVNKRAVRILLECILAEKYFGGKSSPLFRQSSFCPLTVKDLGIQKKNLCFTFPEETGNENIIIMHCDLSDLESVQKFSKDFLAKESALHILINNAGKIEQRRTLDKPPRITVAWFGRVNNFRLNHSLQFIEFKIMPSVTHQLSTFIALANTQKSRYLE